VNEQIKIWTADTGDYRLLDSGNGQRLEEVGGLRIIRAEPRAWWQPSLSQTEWQEAGSLNELNGKVIEIGGFKTKIKTLKNSKHIGIFPEQTSEWVWIEKMIKEAGRPINVLNLFGYTGLASLAAARAGAKVTHVDGSRPTIAWAKENQELSGLTDKPIRWILDDARAFVKREVKRGERYDAIILDPPTYGRGPKGEVWKIEEDLPKLLALCKEVLSQDPLFVILNMYSTELSSLSLKNLLSDLTANHNGIVEAGELVLQQESNSRPLPLSIFAIWKK
jgi:23S rRNA (cytosine1962-C5)-methyltransferase